MRKKKRNNKNWLPLVLVLIFSPILVPVCAAICILMLILVISATIGGIAGILIIALACYGYDFSTYFIGIYKNDTYR